MHNTYILYNAIYYNMKYYTYSNEICKYKYGIIEYPIIVNPELEIQRFNIVKNHNWKITSYVCFFLE